MKKYLLLILFLLITTFQAFSQTSQLKLSKLGDPQYFENCVKYLTDEYLFESLNLDMPELKSVKENVDKKEYLKAYEEWGKYWRAKKKPSLFVDYEDQFVDRNDFKNNCSEKTKAQIISETEKIMRNEINGWGLITQKFDSNIDFNYNFGESGKYGFHYFIWSKSLILARLLDDDPKYTAKYDEIFSEWYNQRYRVTGVYKEWDIIYYELGLGVRNKFFITNYILDNPNRNWSVHEKMLKIILGSGNWYYQMEGSQPYTYENRQLIAIGNMGMLGLYFPEFKDSEKWVKLAYEKMMEHLEKDFLADGANVERSPWGYTSLTYNCIRNFYYQLKLAGYPVDKLTAMKNKLIRTVDWWSKILAPNGDMLATNDGARRTFPYSIFEDAIRLYDLKENMGILNSIYGLKKYKQFLMPKEASVNLPKSEFAIMRENWNNNSNYMAINYSGYSGGHSHYDILDFDLYAFGKSQAIDPAIGWTYDDTLHFSWYKKSISHNMIIVNDSNINKKEALAENPYWMSNKKYDYFSATEKKGYARFGVSYKRSIIFIKPDIWIIHDDIFSNRKNNDITWNIHLRGGLTEMDDYYKSYSDSGIIICPSKNYESEVKKGRAMIKYDKTSDDFEDLAWLRFSHKGEGNFNFCNLLYPYTSKRDKIVFKEIFHGKYSIKDGSKEIFVYFPGKNFKFEEIMTDAEAVIVNGSEIQIINGSYLKMNNKDYLKEKNKGNYSVSL